MKEFEIQFEGITLPRYAFNIDLASNNLPDLPEETQSWFFHFTACRGVDECKASAEVIKYCKSFLAGISAHTVHLKKELSAKFDEPTIDVMIKSWKSSAELMIQLSENRDRVNWTGK
jgi:hypothetical protein